MSNIRFWRVAKISSIFLTAVFLLAISMLVAEPAQAQNNAPAISSEPTLVVTTDQTYSYAINAADIDNNDVEFSLTMFPEGMTISGNEITWSPTIIGTYNVVAQVTDNNGGYDSQSWQITVKAGDVRSIEVTPNDKPTIMEPDKTAQFTAKAYDQYGNLIEGAEFTWTADNEYTTVDGNGLVTAVKEGIGYVKANIGDIQSAPGILVQASEPADETVENDQTEEAEQSDEEVNNEENQEETELMSSAENTDEDNNDEDSEEICEENINHSLTFILLIIYAAILIVYFMYEKKHKSSSWWIFPLLITFIGLIVYYRYFCPQTYLWWPWIMVLIGVIITGFYKGRTKTEDDATKNELPF